MSYRRIASLKTADDFLAYVGELDCSLPFDREMVVGTGEFLDEPFLLGDQRIGNRFSILPMEGLPMEGWDGETDGSPSEHTRRRWRRFGDSGAKLIWGGEAVAVEHAGRANPHQLWMHHDNLASFVALREELLAAHLQAMGTTDDLLVGLQLTHSGRFARPNTKSLLEPQVLYRHPVLEKGGEEPYLLTDEDLSSGRLSTRQCSLPRPVFGLLTSNIVMVTWGTKRLAVSIVLGNMGVRLKIGLAFCERSLRAFASVCPS